MYAGKVELCGVDTARLPVLSEAEKSRLIKAARAGDRQARQEMVQGNLRLVLSVVQRFAGRGENMDDLFQVGCIGLIKAIDNFDPAQNVVCSELLFESVNHLFERLYMFRRQRVVFRKSRVSSVQHFRNCLFKHGKFRFCRFGERFILVFQLFRGFDKIYRMIRDSFEVSDTFEQFCGCNGYVFGYGKRRQTDEIFAQHIFVFICLCFFFTYAFGKF